MTYYKRFACVVLVMMLGGLTMSSAQSVALEYWLDDGQDSLVLNLGSQGVPFAKVRNITGWSNGIDSSPFWQTTDSIFQYENNHCLRFETSDDWVYLGRGDSNNISLSAVTVEAWVKPENRADPKHQYIFWGSTDVVRFAFRVTEDLGLQRLMVIIYDENQVAHVIQSLSGSILPGVWQHIAFTYDEIMGGRLFVNGEMLTSMPTFGALFQPYGRWAISAPNIFSFYGCIDELRVSDFTRVPGNGDGRGMNLAWNTSLKDLATDAVVLEEPADSAIDVSAEPILSWTDSYDAEYYMVQVSRIDDFSDLLVDTSEFYETSLALSGLDYDSLYYWRVGLVDEDNLRNWSEVRTFTVISNPNSVDLEKVPAVFNLAQNYPNPFNPVTTISYTVSMASDVSIKIYDMLGSEVSTLVNQHLNPGIYTARLDATDLSTGNYLYVMKAGEFSQTRRLTVLK